MSHAFEDFSQADPLDAAEDKKDLREENLDVPKGKEGINRRTFLRMLGVGLAGAGSAVSFPPLYESTWNSLGKEDLESKIESLETELSKKYGILIRVWEKHTQDRPIGIIRESLKEYSLYRSYQSLLSLKGVLECYPPPLIEDNVSGIEIVYSVKDAYKEAPEGSTTQAVTSIGGNITIRAGFQSALSYEAAFGDVLEPEVVHHEIAHLLTDRIPRDEWRALHPEARYVGDEWIIFKSQEEKPAGFALPYSTYSIDEDIATTAELLFVDPAELKQLVNRDAVLQRKVDFLKKWYILESNGKMQFT